MNQCTSTADCQIKIQVSRSGSFAGIASEVVQIYIGFQPAVTPLNDVRAIKDLRGFLKVWDTTTTALAVKPTSFLLDWDKSSRKFISPCETQSGRFVVYVGTSSSDIVAYVTLPC